MNDLQLIQGGGLPTRETASSAVAAQAIAAIQARCVMARANPRNWDAVRDKIMRECRRPGFAGAAEYRVPRGFTPNGERNFITGPTIRFVEVALRSMGNVETQHQTIYDDDEKRIVRVTVLDIETNASYSRDITLKKTMERRQLRDKDVPISQRKNADGIVVYTLPITEDELLLREASLVSKAIRTLGERFVPGDFIDEAMAECKRTLAKEDKKNPEAARHKLLDAFAIMGVSVSDLEEYLGTKTERVTPAQIEDLRDIYVGLKEGVTTWEEVIAPVREQRDAKKKETKTAKETGARGDAAIMNQILALKLQDPEKYQLVCTNFSVPHKNDDWMTGAPILGDFLAALQKEISK